MKSTCSLYGKFAVLFAALLSVPFTAAAQDTTSALQGLDAEVTADMQALHVPGVAVGVIRDGKVIYAKGYGVRRLGSGDPVDADTIFAVGSISKSFTTSVMATLVDEGKLQWNKPVRDYWPEFALADPIATELATPRDLVTHRTGMARHDFLRMSMYESREELMQRLRYLEPVLTFRDSFRYNNLAYTAAGYLAGQVAGSTWEELVHQRVFLPLGMTRSNTSTEDTQKQENFASPHERNGDAVKAVPFYVYQRFGVGPNGAVNTTVHDLLKYATMQLDDGKFDGRQVISAAQIKELHKPVLFASAGTWGSSDYALGWFITEHRHHTYVEHSGSITGFASQLILDPETKTGIIVLNNLGSALPQIVGWSIADRLAGLPAENYLADVEKRQNERAQQVAKIRENLATQQVKGTKTTLSLDAYAGEYFHPAYGVIHVERNGDGLTVKFNALSLPLKHYHYDTFECEVDGEPALATFRLSSSGKVEEMLLPLESTVKPLVFVKR